MPPRCQDLRSLQSKTRRVHLPLQVTEYYREREVALSIIAEENQGVALASLEAGRVAKHSGNFSLAFNHFRTGLANLGKEKWQTTPTLALDLHAEAGEAAFLLGRYDDMEHLLDGICAGADLIGTCRAYRLRIRALKARNMPDKALACGLEILFLCGIRLPLAPSRPRSRLALLHSRLLLTRVNRSELLNMEEMQDKKASMIMGILYEIAIPAVWCGPSLVPILNRLATRLTLKHGNCRETALTCYLLHGVLYCSLPGQRINQGYAFGQLARQLRKQLEGHRINGQLLCLFNDFVSHWKDHLQSALPQLKIAIHNCFENGDLEGSANAACSCSQRLYLLGLNLYRARDEMERHHEHIKRTAQQSFVHRQQLYRQAVNNLLEKTEDPSLLAGTYYNERQMIPVHENCGDHAIIFEVYLIKLIHCVLFNRYQDAIRASDEAAKYRTGLEASLLMPLYLFYDAIARLALYGESGRLQRYRTLASTRATVKKMRRWARLSPGNYAHKCCLVEAELQRVLGKSERAMEQYDKAIQLAKKSGYLQEEGIAYELAARFYGSRHRMHITRLYMREARYCYYRWGAAAKARQLDAMEWSAPVKAGGEKGDGESPDSPSALLLPGEGGSRLDMMTVIKASRILSEEMVLDELLKKIMRILMESVGAQRGFLIFREDEQWLIKARGSIYRKSVVTLCETPVEQQEIASQAIIDYVTTSAMDVILNDAGREGLFVTDPYVLEKKPRSVLCMPIIHQEEIFCILYLENNLATGAFPPDRQELLHLLGTQAAISLKNSRLFQELELTVGRLNTEIEKRKDTQLQLLHAEKLSALGRLSASIAHEFGNPLMGLKCLIDDFRQREDISESDKTLLDLGIEECERMKQLLRNLQQLNKPSSGKETEVDLHRLIDNVLLFQKKHLSIHRIRVQKKYDYTLPRVWAIEDQITQVLFNLTMNAADAMADMESGTLAVSTRKTKGGVVIDVSDTGIGIPYDHQEQVFEPLFSTKTEEDGTGLGLSISYGIVKHHGGNLSFVSSPGGGTTFSIFLPTEDAAAMAKIMETTSL